MSTDDTAAPRSADQLGITERRIGNELRAAAREIRLTPGSEVGAVAAGRRRQHRRRRATTLTLVTALGAGTAVGIQQLADGGADRVALDETASTADTGTVPADVTAPSTKVLLEPVQTAPAPTSDADDTTVPLATVVESDLVWNVVEVDAPEAVAFAQLVSSGSSAPLIALGTEPGRSNNGVSAWWRSDDGIAWQQISLDVPVGQDYGAVFDGASVYAVGTAPGIAATEQNPLVLAASSDEGASWDEIELPVDTNAARSLPLVRSVNVGATPVAIDGGVLVVVRQYVDLDWEAVLDEAGIGGDLWGTGADGVQVIDTAVCETPSATTAPLLGLTELGGITAATVPAYVGANGLPCDVVTVAWDDLGLPPETRALVGESPQARGFRVVGGEITEVDVPTGNSYGTVDGRPLFRSDDGGWFQVNAAGEFEESTIAGSGPGGTPDFWPMGGHDGVMFASSGSNSAFGTWREYFGSSAGGEWTWGDWSELYGPDSTAMRMSSGVTAAGLTSAVAVSTDPLVASGGVEVSTEGITITRRSQRSEPEFSFTESGEPIPLTQVKQDMTTGEIVVLDAEGGETARLRQEIVSSVLYGGYGGSIEDSTWYLETSADGVHVATERLADLLGVDDADISSVPRISTDGTNTIVAVTMTERDADGVPKQMVLIGTPRA